MVLVDISFIKSGGGAAYVELISEMFKGYEIQFISNNKICKKQAIIWKKLIQRDLLIKDLDPEIIINLSNVPYFFSFKNVWFFLHQRYYVDKGGLKYLRGIQGFKMRLKRFYFRILSRKSYRYIVQTEVMRQLLQEALGYESSLSCLIDLSEHNRLKTRQAVLHHDTFPHKKVNWQSPIFDWLDSNGIDLVVVGAPPPVYIKCRHIQKLAYRDMTLLLARSEICISFSKFDSLGLPYVESCIYGLALFSIKTDVAEEICEKFYDINNIDYDTLQYSNINPTKFRESFKERNRPFTRSKFTDTSS